MRFILKIIDTLEKICLSGSVIAVLIIMLATNVDVLLRKVSDYAIPSLYEVTQDYLMVALVFLSISYVYKKGGHVRVTLFLGVIPEKLKGPLDKLLTFFVLIFFVMMTVIGWNAGMEAVEFNEMSSSSLGYPLAPAFFMVPVGCGIACLRIIMSFFVPESIEQRE